VYGFEAMVSHGIRGPWGSRLRGDLSYTLTLSEFQTSFVSENPLFGNVTEGDILPYVPQHQGGLAVSIGAESWETNLGLKYVGEMRDVAGQGPIPQNEQIPGHFVTDMGAHYQVFAAGKLYANIYNLFDNETMVSRRPYGPRPGRPRQAVIGLKVQL
jgi:Fe(3+) dicitrate transport protein